MYASISAKRAKKEASTKLMLLFIAVYADNRDVAF